MPMSVPWFFYGQDTKSGGRRDLAKHRQASPLDRLGPLPK